MAMTVRLALRFCVVLIVALLPVRAAFAATYIKSHINAFDAATGIAISGKFAMSETGYVVPGGGGGEDDYFTYALSFGSITIGDQVFLPTDYVIGSWAPFFDAFYVYGSNGTSSFDTQSTFFGRSFSASITGINYRTPTVTNGLFDSAELSVGRIGQSNGTNALIISFVPEPEIWLQLVAGFIITGSLARRRIVVRS